MKYLVVALFVLAMLATLGCAAPLRNVQGESLTFPRPNPAVSIDKTWFNDSSVPFFVGPENEGREEILPGGYRTWHRRSDREERWTIIWPREKGINENLVETPLTRTGVFPGGVIHVDDFFLRGSVAQAGVVINKEVYAFHVHDGRNNDYGVLYPRQSTKICYLMPGPITFYADPVDPRYGYHGTRTFDIVIDDKPDNVIWVDANGQQHLLGWNIIIKPQSRR